MILPPEITTVNGKRFPGSNFCCFRGFGSTTKVLFPHEFLAIGN